MTELRETTYVGALWTILKAVENPDSDGLILSTNDSTLKGFTLPALIEVLETIGVDYSLSKSPPKAWGIERTCKSYSQMLVLENGAHIFLRCGRNSDKLRGLNVGWIWADGTTATDSVGVLKCCLRQDPAEWKQTW